MKNRKTEEHLVFPVRNLKQYLPDITIRSRAIISSFVFTLILIKSPAQPSLRSLESHMTKVRTNPTEPIPQSILSDTMNKARLITTLVPYFPDTLNTIRSKAYNITELIRQKVASQLKK